MRTAFVDGLVAMAEADDRVFLLTGDLGWSVLERFAQRFPERFLNAGVAEANMAGLATGLARAGFVPFAYSIATFASMRCYEAVRNGPVLHGLPVRIVGIGGGYAYGHAGPTHHALEDLAIYRCQPGMTVLAPADPRQLRSVLEALKDLPGPAYLRVGKGGNAEVPGLEGRFGWGRPETIREGSDVVLIACGGAAHEALEAAARLEREGISAAVAVLAHLGFGPDQPLVDLLGRFPAAVGVEEGFRAGGLSSLLAEAIATSGLAVRMKAVGVDTFGAGAGSPAFLRARAGMDPLGIARAAREALGRS